MRGTPSSNQGVCASEHQANTETATPKHKRGRPKGSRNRNKNVVVPSGVLKQLQTMVKGLLQQVGNLIPLRYFVLDGYFGHNNALQMTKQCRLHLISKLRTDAALYFPPTTPYAGKGRPRIYGERLDPRQIDAKYCLSTDTIGNLKTEVYQMEARHKKFADELNVVCILKTNLTTKQQAHVLLFSSDLTLDAEKMIDYYALRFQIEFNFRDAKQYWGLQDFMNVNKIPVNNAVNLSMFMVSVSAKLTDTFRCPNTEFSVLDLKARYRGAKYLHETLKILPKKPDTIVIEQIAQHLGSIGAIHQTQQKTKPRIIGEGIVRKGIFIIRHGYKLKDISINHDLNLLGLISQLSYKARRNFPKSCASRAFLLLLLSDIRFQILSNTLDSVRVLE